MLKLLYASFVTLNVAAVLFFLVLGLAAAGPSRTSPVSVVVWMVGLPALPLALSLWLFLRGTSPMSRGVGFALAAAPLVIVLVSQALNDARVAASTNEQGDMTFFSPGPQRELAEAIRRNDAAAVAAALQQAPRKADANATGTMGMTPLVLALRQLRKTPQQHAVLELLLQAGARPDQAVGYEQPLEMALQVAARTGPRPATLLLTAGADPNLKTPSGRPAFFAASGHDTDPQLLQLLLRHGADLRATATNGETVLLSTATASNWRAARLLLALGAEPTLGRTSAGQSFAQVVEHAWRQREARGTALPHDEGLEAVRELLRHR